MAHRLTPPPGANVAAASGATWRAWLAVLPYVRPFRMHLAAGFVLLTVNIGMDVLKPWPLKWIFDGVLLHRAPQIPVVGSWLATRGDLAVLGFACATILATAIVAGICEYTRRILFATAGHRAVTAVRRDLSRTCSGCRSIPPIVEVR